MKTHTKYVSIQTAKSQMMKRFPFPVVSVHSLDHVGNQPPEITSLFIVDPRGYDDIDRFVEQYKNFFSDTTNYELWGRLLVYDKKQCVFLTLWGEDVSDLINIRLYAEFRKRCIHSSTGLWGRLSLWMTLGSFIRKFVMV